MAGCSYCGKKVSMPFRCSLCGESHCTEHRLPESHNCINIGAYQTESYKKQKVALRDEARSIKQSNFQDTAKTSSRGGAQMMQPPAQGLWSSGNKPKDLVYLSLVVALAGYIGNLRYVLPFSGSEILTSLIFTLGISYVGVVAVSTIRDRISREEGVSSYFVFYKIGLIITLISTLIGAVTGLLLRFMWPGFFIIQGGFSDRSQGRPALYTAIGFLATWAVLNFLVTRTITLMFTDTSIGILLIFLSSITARSLLFLGVLGLIYEGRSIYNWKKNYLWALIVVYIFAYISSIIA